MIRIWMGMFLGVLVVGLFDVFCFLLDQDAKSAAEHEGADWAGSLCVQGSLEALCLSQSASEVISLLPISNNLPFLSDLH